MVLCPLCNNQMTNIASDDYNGYGDAYLCENCNVEQAVFWDHGERIMMHRKDGENMST